MSVLTLDQVAFLGARAEWNNKTAAERRKWLKELEIDEVYGECAFGSLPAATRNTIIEDFAEEHIFSHQ